MVAVVGDADTKLGSLGDRLTGCVVISTKCESDATNEAMSTGLTSAIQMECERFQRLSDAMLLADGCLYKSRDNVHSYRTS